MELSRSGKCVASFRQNYETAHITLRPVGHRYKRHPHMLVADCCSCMNPASSPCRMPTPEPIGRALEPRGFGPFRKVHEHLLLRERPAATGREPWFRLQGISINSRLKLEMERQRFPIAERKYLCKVKPDHGRREKRKNDTVELFVRSTDREAGLEGQSMTLPWPPLAQSGRFCRLSLYSRSVRSDRSWRSVSMRIPCETPRLSRVRPTFWARAGWRTGSSSTSTSTAVSKASTGRASIFRSICRGDRRSRSASSCRSPTPIAWGRKIPRDNGSQASTTGSSKRSVPRRRWRRTQCSPRAYVLCFQCYAIRGDFL